MPRHTRLPFPTRRPAISAVVFDYGNVLSRPQNPDLIRELEALSNVPSQEFAFRYMRRRLDYDRGTLSTEDYWADVLDSSDIEPERLGALVRVDIASWVQLDDQMIAWTETLRSVGVATAILSNMPHDILNGLRRSHESMLERFAVRIFSCETGRVKPEAEVYELLLERLGLPAAALLFVDDREENVAAATGLGMYGVHYRSPGELWQELEADYDLPRRRSAAAATGDRSG